MRPGEALITGDHWAFYGVLCYTTRRPPIIAGALSLGAFREAVERAPNPWYIYWAPLPAYIQEVVDARMEPAAVFPGMLGDVHVMRTKR
jgi:hypothetical protein